MERGSGAKVWKQQAFGSPAASVYARGSSYPSREALGPKYSSPQWLLEPHTVILILGYFRPSPLPPQYPNGRCLLPKPTLRSLMLNPYRYPMFGYPGPFLRSGSEVLRVVRDGWQGNEPRGALHLPCGVHPEDAGFGWWAQHQEPNITPSRTPPTPK